MSVTQSGSATGSTVYSYDNNGNITNNGIYTFAYDYKNRLVKVKKVSDNSTVVQYAYDILGRRVQKTTSSTKTDYIYAGENAIRENTTNLSTSGTIITNRIFGIGTDNMLAYETDDSTLSDSNSDEYGFCTTKVTPSSTDFTKYGWTAIVSRCNDLQNQYIATARKMFFVQKDHLGSTIGLTDASGSLVQSYKYDVYGSAYVSSGTGYIAMKDFTGNLHGNARLFTGREYDGEIGLYYLRARYYSPDTGRFISRDPIGQVDDVNLYQYAKNSPIRYLDPTGLSSKSILGEYNWNPYPYKKIQELKIKADRVAIIGTTPYDPDGTAMFQVHSEIVFYKNNNPIASLGSAPLLGWQMFEYDNTYTVQGTQIGNSSTDVVGCIDGLNNSFATNDATLGGKLTACWHGASSCYNNATHTEGTGNMFIDWFIPTSY